MKKPILVSFILFIVVLAAQSQYVEPTEFSEGSPVFKWEKTSIDLGKTGVDQPVTAVFKFTNTGNAPLIISSVKASCQCTVPKYSTEPIAPGKTGFIEATYNAHAPGTFAKSVTVISNIQGDMTVLTIQGEVIQEKPLTY
jgi:hypothetical protein